MNHYIIIKSYIDSDIRDINDSDNCECLDIFKYERNEIYKKRIPHKMIINLLAKSADKNHCKLMEYIFQYIKEYKLQYYQNYTNIFLNICVNDKLASAKIFMENENLIYPNFKENLILGQVIKSDNFEFVKLLLENHKVIKSMKSWMIDDFYIWRTKSNESYNYFARHSCLRNMRSENLLRIAINEHDLELANLTFSNNMIKNIHINDNFLMRYSCITGKLEFVKLLLDNMSESIDVKSSLIQACEYGHYDIIEVLLQSKLIKVDESDDIILLDKLLYYYNLNSKNSKSVNVLVNYDIISKKTLGKIKEWIYNRINDNFLLKYPFYNFSCFKRNVNRIIIENPKLNELYHQTIILIMSKKHFFEEYYIPNDIINLIVVYLHKLSIDIYK